MIALDTNILVYAHRQDSPFHHPALATLNHLGIRTVADLTDETAEDYLMHWKRREGPVCLRLLLGFFREKGILNRIIPPKLPAPVLLEEYRDFLRRHRGVGERTIQAHFSHVQRFPTRRGLRPGEM